MNRRLLVCVTNMARQLALVVSIFLSLGATPQAFATSGPLPGYYDSCAGAAVGPAAGLFNSFPSDTQVHTRTLISSGSNYNYQVQLKRIADRQGGTLFMTLLAAFNVLLHRYTGQNDLCIGTPIANRQYGETEGLIGMFVNTLALRSQVEGDDTFAGLLSKVRTTCLDPPHGSGYYGSS